MESELPDMQEEGRICCLLPKNVALNHSVHDLYTTVVLHSSGGVTKATRQRFQ